MKKYQLISIGIDVGALISSFAFGASTDMDHSTMSMQGGSAPADARDPNAYSGGFTLDSGPYALPGERELKLADEQKFGRNWI